MKNYNEENIKKVLEHITQNYPKLENIRYTIRDDGKIIKFTANNILKEEAENLSDKSLECIKYIEKTLNVKYKGITDINQIIYFNFRL